MRVYASSTGTNVNEPSLRAYLLGQLPAAEADGLEERLLEDEELFLTLRGVEDDLFDAYVRGTLTDDERRRFEERHDRRKERIAFARALAARAPSARVIPFARRPWVPLAAAAALAVAIGGDGHGRRACRESRGHTRHHALRRRGVARHAVRGCRGRAAGSPRSRGRVRELLARVCLLYTSPSPRD